MASSPAIVVCTVCHMYSLSLSVSSEGFTCDKCREIVRLTEKILEIETRIQTLVEDSKNVRDVNKALDATNCTLFGSGRAHAAGQLGDLVVGQNTVLPFRSECQTGSPHSVTHPLRNRDLERLTSWQI